MCPNFVTLCWILLKGKINKHFFKSVCESCSWFIDDSNIYSFAACHQTDGVASAEPEEHVSWCRLLFSGSCCRLVLLCSWCSSSCSHLNFLYVTLCLVAGSLLFLLQDNYWSSFFSGRPPHDHEWSTDWASSGYQHTEEIQSLSRGTFEIGIITIFRILMLLILLCTFFTLCSLTEIKVLKRFKSYNLQ